MYDSARRLSRLVRLGPFAPKSYHAVNAERAAKYVSLKGAKVLVVGANDGRDCKLFVAREAAEVHGLDVIDGVGKEFPHPRVTYHRHSIEASTLPAGYFDLAFAVATMEHVHDIEAAFAEMARVVRPGGVVYCLAAPLWQSRFGHHMSCFEAHPWIHLVFARDALIAYARSHGIEGERGHSLEDIVDYMLHPDYFNMKPARAYLAACERLSGVRLEKNELDLEPRALLDHPLGRAALERGYHETDLLAVTHTLVARKSA